MNISRRAVLSAPAALVLAQEPRRLKIAFIGAGHRTWAHMQVLKGIPDFEIAALADPTPEFMNRASAIAGPGVRTYAAFPEMLAREKDLDAVVVVTPNFLHADATVAALSAGHHVLCEKPMATTIEDANRMLAASEMAGRHLQIGLQMRYDPLYGKMAEVVRSGAIGTPRYVSGNLFRGDWNPGSWKYRDPRSGVTTNWRFLTHTAGASLMEDGIHEIDVLHGIIGARVARVYASGGNNVYKERETIDHAGIVIDYENGVKLTFNFCLFGANSGPVARQMVLAGTKGVMETSNRDGILIGRPGAHGLEAVDTAPRGGSGQDVATYREYLAFAHSIRSGEKPLVSGQIGKEAIKISLLAEKSLRERRPLSWNDLPA